MMPLPPAPSLAELRVQIEHDEASTADLLKLLDAVKAGKCFLVDPVAGGWAEQGFRNAVGSFRW